MSLPEIAPDKANHAAYGAGVSLAGFAAALAAGISASDAALFAAAAAAVTGAAKEVADAIANVRATGNWRTGPHSVDPLDALWTGAGAAPLLCAVYLPGVFHS